MPKTKVEVYDKDQLIYPFIESDHVTFSNGMKVSEMLDQSISMPKVIHEDSSFKVGVGDQDVSSAIVDSSVAEMTIKGKTYQNILPEPSTHVLTNNKEMFKVNEGLDPNVEIVDGVAKSAILKGQTLVNVVSSYSFGGTSILYESRFYDRPFNAGETFTVFVVNPNVTTIKVGLHNSVSNEWNGETEYNVSDNKKIVYTVPTGDNLCKYVGVRVNTALDSTGFENSLVIVSGDKSDLEIENYFEGMQSVKMPVLTTVGKNLCKYRDNWTYGGLTFTNTENGVAVNGTATVYVDYYVIDDRNINLEIRNQLNSLPVGTRLILSNNLGKNSYISYTLNGEVRYADNVTIQNNMEIKGAFVRFQQGDICDNLNLTIQLEVGNNATSYEPYKINILSTPEEIVLRGFDSVKDTLNLNTGEYVKCIGELTLDGSEDWQYADNTDGTIRFNLPISDFKNYDTSSNGKNLINNKLPKANFSIAGNTYGVTTWCNHVVFFTEHTNVNDFKQWLSQNPTTIQYELETPVVKTVDLSSSGNWEKVVLDGSENWLMTNNTHFYTMLSNELSPNALLPIIDNLLFTPKDNLDSTANAVWYGGNIGAKNGNIVFNILDKTLEQFKQYLSHNPITVWYQTTNHKDSTQVKQPIFFKDGHIKLSSGVDNSLVPTLDYQAKTSNSYVMDLMKPNTLYTMKAKSASGTFTIDGTSYGAGTNGTFTSPTSMTNKFLVMSNKTNEEVMILEGDVVSKTIPYFKGIKSAFEDESKIEVLSTGKNLFNPQEFTKSEFELNKYQDSYYGKEFKLKPNTQYKIKATLKNEITTSNIWSVVNVVTNVATNKMFEVVNFSNGDVINNTFKAITFTTDNSGKIGFSIYTHQNSAASWITNLPIAIQLEEGTVHTSYESHKSNSTKIPLLSPLRSLPNGVCDEIILDRENNKAKIIQRVAKIVLNGSEAWYWSKDNNKNSVFYTQVDDILKINGDSDNIISNTFANQMSFNVDREGIWFNSMKYILIGISKEKLNGIITRDEMKRWVSKNPITVHYQLNTPIIAEIDLEGFPYVYKDGHIFSNSEIVPTTEITYSINQCQQISASNEDIIRHEKELTYLQKLIAQYVQVDYESVLLSLKV